MNDAVRWDPAVLGEWIEEHKRTAPDVWVAIAKRLNDSREMLKVWPVLAKDGMHPMHVFSVVHHAFADSIKEFRRMPSKEERASLVRVKKAAVRLKVAIEQSPLPRDWGSLREIKKEGRQSVPVVVGWRDLRPDGYGFGYPIAIVDVLDLAVELVQQYEDGLPRRTVPRRKDGVVGTSAQAAANTERARMFIRWLTYRIKEDTGHEHHTSVAHITNVVLRPSQPFDADRVKLICKDSPAEFRKPPRRQTPSGRSRAR